ncbi:MAG: hypothetical protein JSS93_11720 [Bacteroidetes bacterium]|nr:hypothetical protein [Bacteroidota bacterium]
MNLLRSLFCYVDPGVGSIIAQATIAGIVSVVYTLKLYGQKIKSFFSGFFKTKKQDSARP